MGHSYIAYKREDEVRVGRVVAALQREGLDIWWDRELPGSESWQRHLEDKLDTAACVIVFWSRNSVAQTSMFVLDEARRGLARGVLVPVLLDPVRIPLGFGEIQAVDLTRWKGRQSDPFFQDLVAAVRAKVDGRAAPAPRGPMRRVRQRLVYSTVSGVGLAALFGLGFNTFGVAARLCTVSGAQPALSDGCGALGIGERPTRDERLAWERRDKASCDALREHIRRFPDGAYRAQAADLLSARQVTRAGHWQPTERRLPLYVSADGPAVATEAQARAAAVQRGARDAERLCRGFGAGTLYRYRDSRPVAETWLCDREGAAHVCGFEGSAVCALQVRETAEREQCGGESMRAYPGSGRA